MHPSEYFCSYPEPCIYCERAKLREARKRLKALLDPLGRAERMEEIERRRDNVLAEYNSDLPMYEPR